MFLFYEANTYVFYLKMNEKMVTLVYKKCINTLVYLLNEKDEGQLFSYHLTL